MGQIKKLLAALKKMGVPPEVLAGLLIAAILGFLFYKWWSARKKAAADKEEAPATAPDAQPAAAAVTKVPKDRFTSVYQRFRDELPPVVRRSLGNFAPFVVMGTDSAATARLINGYTDWERQARFLFGSHVDDPNLKIYLGSRVLVLDVPESVLAETSSSARTALLRLWRPLFRRRAPTVVVAVSPTKLAGLRPEQIGDLADSIRGKVNLLSWVCKKPVEIRVAMTDLEEVPGFAELADLADRNHVPLTIEVAEGVADYQLEGQLNERFAALYDFLQLGLTDLPQRRFAAHFTELVRFLRDAPASLSPNIATFLAALMVRQPLGEQPILREVHMTGREGKAGPATPFATRTSPSKRRGPLFWHKVAAISAAALLGLTLVGGYMYERSLYLPAKAALDKYTSQNELTDQPGEEARLRDEVSRFANRTAFPGFFAHAQQQMQAKLRKRILDLHIAEALSDAIDDQNGLRRTIYLVALAYAAKETPLGELTDNAGLVRRWAKGAGLPEDMVRDYVVSAEQPNLGQVRKVMPLVRLRRSPLPKQQESFTKTWLPFFKHAARLSDAGTLNRVDLHMLQEDARMMVAELARVETHPDAALLLEQVTNMDPELSKLEKSWGPYMLESQRPGMFLSGDKREKVGRYLARVVQTEVNEVPKLADLNGVCGYLSRTLDPSPASGQSMGILGFFVSDNPGSTELAKFSVDDLLIQEADWLRLTRDKSVREALKAFAQRPLGEHGLFFTARDRFGALELNPDTKGRFLFAGKARVPGRFTMEAVEKRVLPPLECLAEVWPRTQAIASSETRAIEQMIARELEDYAARYDRYLTSYYTSFRLETKDSIDALKTVLAGMLRGNSPFTQHLLTVAQNSRLPARSGFSGQFLRPLEQRLEAFDTLRQVATSTKTEGTPLGDYLVFVAQIQESLLTDPRSEIVDAPEAGAEETAAPAAPPALEDLLSPSGRMALEMQRCGPDSPLVRIEAWLEEVRIPKALRGPFLSLAQEIYLVGRQNIEGALARVWQQEVVTSLQVLTLRFPFQSRSDIDVTPKQLTDVLHPVTGRFALVQQNYLDPVKARPPECRFRYARQAPLPPPGATQIVPKLRAISSRLWDDKGQPKVLTLGVSPVAFTSRLLLEPIPGSAESSKPEYLDEVLTLTFISSGPTTLVNFNQRPFETPLELDWTKPHLAQVGVRLTNPETREEVLPDRLSEESNWALLKLLARAERRDQRYSWEVPNYTSAAGSRRRRVVADVTFELAEDPFALFELSSILETQAALQQQEVRRP